jgi:soluble lytic murein transglycosylase-like protein
MSPRDRSAGRLNAILFVLGCALNAATFAQTVPPQLDANARTQKLTELTEYGVRFEHAEGVEKDYPKAQAFYCAAAREGHADALIRLGWMYANARGVARDDAIAATLFKRASDLGSEMAGRLADLVKSNEEKLPVCLVEKKAQANLDVVVAGLLQTPPTSTSLQKAPDRGATPTVPNPAQFKAGPPSIERQQLVKLVTLRARAAKIDPRLVFAIIFAESNFDPLVRSPKGALGLMQLIPETAERFGVVDVWNPEENIRGGVAYLRWLLSYFRGDVWLAIAGYNAGEGTIDRFKGIPPYSETMAYVQKIRALYPRDFHAYDSKVVGGTAFLSKR